MVRKLVSGVGVAALMVALSVGGQSADEKVPEIKEMMKKGHGSKGLLVGIAAHAKAKEWDDAINDAKLLKEFGEGLGKNKPPKGSEESWKKLTDKYKKNTAAVAEAADAKDAKKVEEALGKIVAKSGSCKECHDAHKGK